MEKYKLEFISFLQTFGALFLTNFAFSFSQLPADQIISGKVFTSAFIVGLLSAAARSAFKAAWQKTLPVQFGGKK